MEYKAENSRRGEMGGGKGRKGESRKSRELEHQKAYEGARKETMDGTMADCLDCNSCSSM